MNVSFGSFFGILLAWLACARPVLGGKKYVLSFRDDVPLLDMESFCEKAESDAPEFNLINGLCEGKGWKLSQWDDDDNLVKHPGVRRFERFKMIVFEAGSEEDIRALSLDPELRSMVLSIEEDKLFSVDDSTTAREVESQALDRLDQDELPLDGIFDALGHTGEGVHVFVVDTGLRTTHEEFEGRVGSSYNAFIEEMVVNSDDNGHGSHVSGICCGTTIGLAPDVIIHPVKVMDSMGNGYLSGILDGLEWIEEQLLQHPDWPAVIIMSISGGKSPALNEAIDNLIKTTDVLVVTSAGNYPRGGMPDNACDVSPASAELVLTVGSASTNDTLSPFSNVGPCVDIFAPGEDIESAWYTSDEAMYILSGTSMATPLVAGAAALYLQSFPEASVEEVKKAILKKATVTKEVDPLSEYTGTIDKVLNIGKLVRWLPPADSEVLQTPAPEPEEEANKPPEPPKETTPPPPSEEKDPVDSLKIPCKLGPWLPWSGECFDAAGLCKVSAFQFRARQIVQLPSPGASCGHIQEGRVCPCTIDARREEAQAFSFPEWMFAKGL